MKKNGSWQAQSVLAAGCILFGAGGIALVVWLFCSGGGAAWETPVTVAGTVAVAAGILLIFLSAWLKKRLEARFRAQEEAKLAENESLLTELHIGRFTDEGLCIRTEEEVFGDFAASVPYERLSVCYFTARALPAQRGREEKLFVAEDGESGEEGFCLPLDGRTEKLALEHGVKVSDKRSAAERQSVLKKFYECGRRTRAKRIGFFVALAAVLCIMAGVGVLCVLCGGMEKAEIPYYLLLCLIILLPLTAAGGTTLLWRQKLVVYQKGIRIHYWRIGCVMFVPMGTVERIKKVSVPEQGEWLVIDVGFTRFGVPDHGAFSFLKEKFPEKCAEEQIQSAKSGEETI